MEDWRCLNVDLTGDPQEIHVEALTRILLQYLAYILAWKAVRSILVAVTFVRNQHWRLGPKLYGFIQNKDFFVDQIPNFAWQFEELV